MAGLAALQYAGPAPSSGSAADGRGSDDGRRERAEDALGRRGAGLLRQPGHLGDAPRRRAGPRARGAPGARAVRGRAGAADGYGRMAGIPATTAAPRAGLGNAFANLHNAYKARTPMVNVVGDHAVAHAPLNAPLATTSPRSPARSRTGTRAPAKHARRRRRCRRAGRGRPRGAGSRRSWCPPTPAGRRAPARRPGRAARRGARRAQWTRRPAPCAPAAPAALLIGGAATRGPRCAPPRGSPPRPARG